MIPATITRERIDELLQFLPLFDRPPDPHGDFVDWWGVGERDEDDLLVPPYEGYPPEVVEFFRLADQECWRDYNCDPELAEAMLVGEGLLESASLDQIKTMLTGFVNGEGLWDGHWGDMLCTGYVTRVLWRLEQLRESVP